MINGPRIRRVVAIVWALSFTLLWFTLETLIPKHEFLLLVKGAEQAVMEENWSKANAELRLLQKQWTNSKLLIQITNGSEEVLVVDQLLEQAQALARIEDTAVVEHFAGLRTALQATTVAFPSP